MMHLNFLDIGRIGTAQLCHACNWSQLALMSPELCNSTVMTCECRKMNIFSLDVLLLTISSFFCLGLTKMYISLLLIAAICWTATAYLLLISGNQISGIPGQVSSNQTVQSQRNGSEDDIVNFASYNAGAGKGGFIVGSGICQCGRSFGRPYPKKISRASSRNDIPWTATLTRRDVKSSEGSEQIFCGGTLINDQYILTASHCVDGLDFKDIFVSLSDNDYLPSQSSVIQSTEKYTVSKVIMHHQFNSKSLTHDIALLKLSEPIDFFATQLLPACLPISNDQYHTKYVGTITRWVDNALYGRGNTSSNSLQKVKLPLISVEQCKIKSKYEQTISENMICAGYFNTTKSCQGDSGGPLTITRGDRQLLVGIASWGLGCSKAYSPSIYTRVAKYITWILDNTSDAEFCIE